MPDRTNVHPTSPSIGIVGLGRMGTVFAKNLLEDGYRVVVFDRSAAHTQALASAGALVANDWKDVACCDIVITMVPDDDALAEVTRSLSSVLAVGAIHLSMSTVSPEAARSFADQHVSKDQGYVAAPVLGNPDLAASRKLFVLASGADPYVTRCLPLLERLGQRVFRLGDRPDLANLVKLAGNVLTAATLQSMAEVFAFLHKAGVEPSTAFEVFTGSLFDGKVHKAYGGKIVEQRYSPPGMTLPLAVKDLRLALAEAERLAAPMPVASIVHDRLVTAVAQGWEELDWSALGKLAESSAGLD